MEFNVAKVLSILHGGKIRYSAAISASETTIWDAGRVLEITTGGAWKVSDGTTGTAKGLAMKNRTDLTVTGPTANTLIGTPTGMVASALMDEAIVETDQISGNLLLAVNQTLYVDAQGKLTTSGTEKVGIVLMGNTAIPSLGTAASKARIFFDVQY